MHEAALARQLLTAVLERAIAGRATRVVAVAAWIAEPDRLRAEILADHFALHAVGTLAATARLELRVVAVDARCKACGTNYVPDHGICLCPRCGSPDGELLGTPGLGIDTIEIETGEAGAGESGATG